MTKTPRPAPDPGAPLITVVTPTIPGREQLLAECQKSVADAGLPHLVGVDGKGEGPAVMRNRLVEAVQTPWVVFLDDDDLIYPEYARIVRPHFHRADMVWTGWDLEGADDPQPLPLDPFLLTWRNIIPVTACVRTEVFRALGGFDPSAPLEDHDLWRRLMWAWDQDGARPAYRMVWTPEVAWRYRRAPGSRTERDGDG